MRGLYTSLTRLKMAMNGGQLPPMTPIPENVTHLIDPGFTIGLGALSEDAERGLRCPVRDCGVWRHRLSKHLNAAHADIGGEEAIKRVLQIPVNVRLASSKEKEAVSKRSLEMHRRMPWLRDRTDGARARRKATGRVKRSKTMGYRNLINMCDKQMAHALVDLQNRIGRPPSRADALTALGPEWVWKAWELYGSWEAVLAQFGLDVVAVQRNRPRRKDVLPSLRAWHQAHGEFPSIVECRSPTRTPLVPAPQTIMKSLNCHSWPEAMRRAAALLNIYGGRYGLPEKAKAS